MKKIILIMFIFILLNIPTVISYSNLIRYKRDKTDLSSNININNPPENVSIEGPLIGRAGTLYEYSFYCDDPEDDEVNYYIKWGTPSCPAIYGPYHSSSFAVIGFVWEKYGLYNITVKAVDVHGAESDIVTLFVTMPHFHYCNKFNLLFSKLNESTFFNIIQDVFFNG
jgi:hypothetical protein